MIVVVGDIAVDIVSTLKTPLVRGSDAPAEISLMPGGSGANVAVWLARLGQRATFVGRIGDDMFGRWLRDDLVAEGVDAGPGRGQRAPHRGDPGAGGTGRRADDGAGPRSERSLGAR